LIASCKLFFLNAVVLDRLTERGLRGRLVVEGQRKINELKERFAK